MSNAFLEVSRNAFVRNIKTIEEYIGNKAVVVPVIKANAYGTYLNKDIDLMNNFDMVAVAVVQEAVELRNNGYKKDIFVLNQPYIDDIGVILDNDIVVGVCSEEFLGNVDCFDKKMRVHIELETGMGRTGVLKEKLTDFLNVISACSNVIVEGVYTHLSSADIDDNFTKKQIAIFKDDVSQVKRYFPNIKYIHMSASNGILNFSLGECNVVRPGLVLYGYPSNKSCLNKIKLEPVAKLRSKISYIKDVKTGESIGYGRSYVADKNLVVATVGCGYADGVRRELSNKGYVVVKGKKCRILGNVCMDSFMIDVTGVGDTLIGDDVYIFDNEIVTIDDIALNCGTINYEILTGIGERVARVFVD